MKMIVARIKLYPIGTSIRSIFQACLVDDWQDAEIIQPSLIHPVSVKYLPGKLPLCIAELVEKRMTVIVPAFMGDEREVFVGQSKILREMVKIRSLSDRDENGEYGQKGCMNSVPLNLDVTSAVIIE